MSLCANININITKNNRPKITHYEGIQLSHMLLDILYFSSYAKLRVLYFFLLPTTGNPNHSMDKK